MNWIRDVVTPKIKAFMGQPSKVEENLWTKCPACDRMIYSKELEENLMVCGYCSHHLKISPSERFKSVFDDSEFEKVSIVKTADDPIKYRDTKRYVDRLKDARAKTQQDEAIHIASGKIAGKAAVSFVMDFSFMGGSMGLSVGKSIVKAANLAVEQNAGLICLTASGGARMQEGMLSLMQMPSTIASIVKLKEKKLPFINVLTNPTTGGVLASFAMIGDIHISEPGALLGFAGARVIEKTIKQKLPEGFQRAEFLREHGMVDMIVHRKDLREKLGQLLSYMMR